MNPKNLSVFNFSIIEMSFQFKSHLIEYLDEQK